MSAVEKLFAARRRKWHPVYYHPDRPEGMYTGGGYWGRTGAAGEAERALINDAKLQLIGFVQFAEPVTKQRVVKWYLKYPSHPCAKLCLEKDDGE